jgi:hypothetical protein
MDFEQFKEWMDERFQSVKDDLAAIKADQDRQRAEFNARLGNHDTRLYELEKGKAVLSGQEKLKSTWAKIMLGALTALVGFIGGLFSGIFGSFPHH